MTRTGPARTCAAIMTRFRAFNYRMDSMSMRGEALAGFGRVFRSRSAVRSDALGRTKGLRHDGRGDWIGWTHFLVVSYAFSVTTPACERRAQLWPSFFLRSLSSALHTHFLSCVGRYAHQLRDLHGRCGPPHAPGMRHAGGSCAQVRLRLHRRTLPTSRRASPTSNQKAPRRRRRRYLTVAPLPP